MMIVIEIKETATLEAIKQLGLHLSFIKQVRFDDVIQSIKKE